ncbi:hypothetical protein DIPPA_06469 [Diplonema papillatum]|nr:hypothetical protein DIPPA_06469 [Diplonema papillatum]
MRPCEEEQGCKRYLKRGEPERAVRRTLSSEGRPPWHTLPFSRDRYHASLRAAAGEVRDARQQMRAMPAPGPDRKRGSRAASPPATAASPGSNKAGLPPPAAVRAALALDSWHTRTSGMPPFLWVTDTGAPTGTPCAGAYALVAGGVHHGLPVWKSTHVQAVLDPAARWQTAAFYIRARAPFAQLKDNGWVLCRAAEPDFSDSTTFALSGPLVAGDHKPGLQAPQDVEWRGSWKLTAAPVYDMPCAVRVQGRVYRRVDGAAIHGWPVWLADDHAEAGGYLHSAGDQTWVVAPGCVLHDDRTADLQLTHAVSTTKAAHGGRPPDDPSLQWRTRRVSRLGILWVDLPHSDLFDVGTQDRSPSPDIVCPRSEAGDLARESSLSPRAPPAARAAKHAFFLQAYTGSTDYLPVGTFGQPQALHALLTEFAGVVRGAYGERIALYEKKLPDPQPAEAAAGGDKPADDAAEQKRAEILARFRQGSGKSAIGEGPETTARSRKEAEVLARFQNKSGKSAAGGKAGLGEEGPGKHAARSEKQAEILARFQKGSGKSAIGDATTIDKEDPEKKKMAKSEKEAEILARFQKGSGKSAIGEATTSDKEEPEKEKMSKSEKEAEILARFQKGSGKSAIGEATAPDNEDPEKKKMAKAEKEAEILARFQKGSSKSGTGEATSLDKEEPEKVPARSEEGPPGSSAAGARKPNVEQAGLTDSGSENPADPLDWTARCLVVREVLAYVAGVASAAPGEAAMRKALAARFAGVDEMLRAQRVQAACDVARDAGVAGAPAYTAAAGGAPTLSLRRVAYELRERKASTPGDPLAIVAARGTKPEVAEKLLRPRPSPAVGRENCTSPPPTAAGSDPTLSLRSVEANTRDQPAAESRPGHGLRRENCTSPPPTAAGSDPTLSPRSVEANTRNQPAAESRPGHGLRRENCTSPPPTAAGSDPSLSLRSVEANTRDQPAAESRPGHGLRRENCTSPPPTAAGSAPSLSLRSVEANTRDQPAAESRPGRDRRGLLVEACRAMARFSLEPSPATLAALGRSAAWIVAAAARLAPGGGRRGARGAAAFLVVLSPETAAAAPSADRLVASTALLLPSFALAVRVDPEAAAGPSLFPPVARALLAQAACEVATDECLLAARVQCDAYCPVDGFEGDAIGLHLLPPALFRVVKGPATVTLDCGQGPRDVCVVDARAVKTLAQCWPRDFPEPRPPEPPEPPALPPRSPINRCKQGRPRVRLSQLCTPANV